MDAAISSKSELGLLTLLSLRGVGQKSAIALARRFPTLLRIMDAKESELRDVVKGPVISSVKDELQWRKAMDSAEETIAKSESHSVRVLSVFSPDYPNLLKKIPDPPAILYAKGNLRNDDRFVACVGTREPSEFGQKAAKGMTRMLAEAHWGIVSGLAIGVDAISHQAALDARGYTVAILANGLDSVYPKANQKLADDILESGGAILSEQPIGAKAMGQFLVQRDRLQSGMSLATFVMQTDVVGGTMHTVRFTLTQERLLFAPVPNGSHIREDKSRGIKAMGELNGMEFADLVKADGEYRALLYSEYSNSTPAIPIKNLNEYPQVLERLNQELEKQIPLEKVTAN